MWKLCKHWCDSHQDTLGPHIIALLEKNSRVALKTRRHGLVSPWLAKRQRAKKGPATGCTAWTCARNANKRLISPNIALQRDSLRESKGSKKRHRGLSSAGCGGSESAGSIQQMGRRPRQDKAIPKKLLEKWRRQLFEGPLERSPAAKSKPGFVAAAPSKRRQTHQCDQRRHARGVSKSKWLQVPNRQRMLQRQEGQTATLQRCMWLRCCGGNTCELRSLPPTGCHLEQSQPRRAAPMWLPGRKPLHHEGPSAGRKHLLGVDQALAARHLLMFKPGREQPQVQGGGQPLMPRSRRWCEDDCAASSCRHHKGRSESGLRRYHTPRHKNSKAHLQNGEEGGDEGEPWRGRGRCQHGGQGQHLAGPAAKHLLHVLEEVGDAL